jgi:HPt (histidine-containing phosphotransfer) domain-containing protein
LECGVYLISDWAILNDTQPKQLQRILGEFHFLTPVEIKRSQQLLEAYHAVYRASRLQKRNRGQCTTPTTQQLQEICQRLEDKTNQMFLSDVMRQLQNLANRLRQYRIHVRGGSLPTESLDAVKEYNSLIERIPSVDSHLWEQEEQAEFLQFYRPQFQASLDRALTMVISLRVRQLQRKDEEKARKFLTALHLSHCEKMSMGDIAKLLGLRAQDAVTRLLKLKEFRTDVQQQLLVILRSHVIELAKNYSTTERLATLEAEITLALNEQINSLISQAEAEAQSAKNISSKSHFTERLCKQLKISNFSG